MTEPASPRPSAYRCATAARERDDPLGATATPAQRWLLVENPGPWPFNAFASDAIAPDVLAALAAAIRPARSRLLMIRRHGRRDAKDRVRERRWAVLATDPTLAPVWGTWRDSEDLLEPARLVGEPLVPLAGASAPPTLLVCTHGRHDVCCAVRGRPVAGALAARWPEETWECSHVGGDRFAANVIVVPGGAYYGDLDATSAVTVVEDHLAGRVAVNHLRGVASAPPAGQAAVIAAHRAYGPLPVEAVRCVGSEPVAERRWRARVEVDVDARTVAVVADVVATSRPPAMLTCAAHQETSATTYEVVALSVVE